MDLDIPENKPAEPLFLDLPIQHVLNNDAGMPVKEPWASLYVNAIRDGRFGDAVWARYHISGNVINGIKEGTNKTVLEIIEEDAREYRADDPEDYTEALLFYAKTSSADGHTDVIEILVNIANRNLSQLRAEIEEHRRTHEFPPGHPPTYSLSGENFI